ncbi:hypothetical protein NLG97_g9258 [Lecanicillium saksenae]|uniref:Uncharacterized protein n=1 Tax=Lecanicillium saksenae TaxID=468837 RepID=A0ACC1QJI8_9HYPO|nr:hypothetical protein NLG97_g9258 [Lecanicillium saksenae]
MDSSSEAYLQKLSQNVSNALKGSLTGIFLHGSAVLGGYDARQSDLDVLVVVPNPITDSQRTAVTEVLSEKELPCPAMGLEMSIVTEAAAANIESTAPTFELHLTTAPLDSKVVDGRGHAGDPDLLLHFAVCRASGRNLAKLGTKSREEIFGVVPRVLILSQLRDELTWAASDAPKHYAVLNASRAWMYMETGDLVSKVAGGEWALQRLLDDSKDQDTTASLVQAALAKQNGEDVDMVADDVQRYVDSVLQIMGADGNS